VSLHASDRTRTERAEPPEIDLGERADDLVQVAGLLR